MSERKEGFKNKIGFVIACSILILFVVFVIVILSYDKKTDVSTSTSSSETKTLVCNTGPVEKAFFTIDDASQVQHEVKIMFVDDKISKLFYTYDGKLRDGDAAEGAATDMHIKYDRYLSQRKLESSGNLQTTFSHPGTEVRIDIYTGPEGINGDTASFFFFDNEELDSMMKQNSDGLKKYYTENGFSCVLHD